ncbi:MAG: hypothetical protein ACRDRZ_00175, partial [Pseudonocardiaceae bacterium]
MTTDHYPHISAVSAVSAEPSPGGHNADTADCADTYSGALVARFAVGHRRHPLADPTRQPDGYVPVVCTYCGDWIAWVNPPAPPVPVWCGS